ncbi:MAG TPA: hypothetical protein VHR40_06285 [Thermoleophilaceae bacterium]|jgi:hypothetical protein|nr:hypothetical protein [Thermoleophilaceae bacterium]
MKTFTAVIVLAAALVVPAAAVAKPDASDKRAAIAQCKAERGKSKATHRAFKAKYHSFSRCIHQNAVEEHAQKRAALKNAAKECKAERSDADFPAAHDGKSFQEFYGTGKHGRNAYGKCVSSKARAFKRQQDQADKQEAAAFRNAAKECQSEADDDAFEDSHDGKSFEDFYGTNHNHRNAFGKCVSGKAGEEHYVDPFDDDQGDSDEHGQEHGNPHSDDS